MRKQWAGFLLIVGFRLFVGIILGLLLCLPVTFFAGARRGRGRSALVEMVQTEQTSFLAYWFGAWALVGGLIAVFTIPRWKTPWYKYKRWHGEDVLDHPSE